MSFDEQPDGDIHGECAAEIHRLEQELRDKSEELACCEGDILRWRTSYEHSCTQNVHLCEKIDDCRPFLKEGESPAEGLARFRAKITEIFGRWTLFMDAQKAALTEGGKMIPDERYKQIMADLGMPNSRSLLCALQQIANEVGQKYSFPYANGDIHGEGAAESEPHELSAFEKWWVMLSKVPYMSKKEIAERAFYAGEMASYELRFDACRPYLKEGETAADALARLSAADEWRPIETAPRDGTNVLGWCGSYVDICRTEHKFEVGEVWMTDGCADFGGRESPTHWMPLPSAPTTEGTM